MFEFITKKGELLKGQLVRTYYAFEGGTRYVICVDGVEYRCVKDINGNFVEYIA